MKKIYSLFSVIILSVLSGFASGESTAVFWKDITHDVSRLGAPDYSINHFRLMQLDLQSLRENLATVPRETAVSARLSPAIIEFPLPEGGFARFSVVESPVMAQELSAKYPHIKTYLAQGIDDPTAIARFDITHWGFHAQIRSVNGTVLIDPYNQQTTGDYLVYYKKDANRVGSFACEVDPENENVLIEDLTDEVQKSSSLSIGSALRTYRLALACTGEYAQFHGGTKISVLSAMVTAMNRVNGIYEVEVGIRMILIPNNDTLIFLIDSTDPYSNNSGGTMLGQNQTTLDNYIGTANYDIGHVFSTGGGGVANIQAPCNASKKAKGVTGLFSPIGDPFYVDYVAHEMGHQWGGNHTYNGTSHSCSGGRVAAAAYEPGSATTIMGYAGICGNQNLQSYSDAYFHTRSFDEIIAYSQFNTGNGCAVIIPTGNNEPVLMPYPDFTIPLQTPFILTGSASDPDGDVLTYCWEQFDLGPAGHPNSPSGNAPIFRTFNPALVPHRHFPQIQTIVNDSAIIGEILPTYERTLNFRLTIRDNKAGGGGVIHNTITHKVNVVNTGSPFMIVSPNTNVTWYVGSQQTVLWDVAGTANAPVNSPFVDIILSLDGGLNYLDTLALNVPNTGSAVVSVPATLSTQARVMVKGSGNIFFDISNENFKIEIGSSVNEITSREIELYPVPAKDKINLILSEKIKGAVEIQITDVAGRIINSNNINLRGEKESFNFDINDLSAGLYFIKINSADCIVVKRFIKQ